MKSITHLSPKAQEAYLLKKLHKLEEKTAELHNLIRRAKRSPYTNRKLAVAKTQSQTGLLWFKQAIQSDATEFVTSED